jgi:YVTN family beta-propeller protein
VPLKLLSILIAFSVGAQPFLYVANQNGNSLTVVNTATNAVAASPAASFSPAAMALSPDGTRLYVSNPNANLVIVYNTANNAVVGSFSIGQLPIGIAADAARVYVALQGNAAVAVFSATTLVQQASIRVGFGPSAIAYSQALNRVYVANTYSNSVSVIDPARIGTTAAPVIGTISVPDSPVALALSADGRTAWVASSARSILSRVDLEESAVAARITLPVSPAGLALSPDQSRAYVTGYGPQVTAVDTRAGTVIKTIDLPACPQVRCLAMSAAVSADGKLVYIANTSLNQVSVLNTDTNELTATRINTGQAPRAVVLGPAPRVAPSSTEVSN